MSETLNARLPTLKLALETLREGINDQTTIVTSHALKKAEQQDDSTYTLSTFAEPYRIEATIRIVEDLAQHNEKSPR